MNKKVLAIILARGGSKRLKNKNIKKLNSKPLIYWTLDIACKLDCLIDVVVSSDAKKILEIVKKYNKNIITIKRPKKFSRDKSSSEDAVMHVLKWYEKKVQKIDYFILLQPTSPFRSLKLLKNEINNLNKKKINCIISVKKSFSKNKKKFFSLKKNNNICKEVVSKSLDRYYEVNGSFYILKKEFFLKYKVLTPSTFKGVIMNSNKQNLDIDTPNDWAKAIKLIN